MPRPWMRSFVVFTLAAAGLCAGADGNEPEFVVPNVQDLTIKTRETIDLAQSTGHRRESRRSLLATPGDLDWPPLPLLITAFQKRRGAR